MFSSNTPENPAELAGLGNVAKASETSPVSGNHRAYFQVLSG